MSVLGILLLFVVLWFFYNLFVKVIFPIYKTTNQLKKQFRNMAEQRSAQNETTFTPPPSTSAPKQKAGEYIDFEEIKKRD